MERAEGRGYLPARKRITEFVIVYHTENAGLTRLLFEENVIGFEVNDIHSLKPIHLAFSTGCCCVCLPDWYRFVLNEGEDAVDRTCCGFIASYRTSYLCGLCAYLHCMTSTG